MKFFEMRRIIAESLYGVFADDFVYFPPSDFGKLLADFYGLTAIRNQLRNMADPDEANLPARKALTLFKNVMQAHDKVVEATKEYFLQAIPYVVSVELRHLQMEGHRFLDKMTDKSNKNRLFNVFKDMKATGYTPAATSDSWDHWAYGRPERVRPDYATHPVVNTDYEDWHLRNPDPYNTHPELARNKDFLEKEAASGIKPRNTKNQLAYHSFFVNHFDSVDKLIDFAIWAFAQQGLWEENYGGPAWEQIAKYYKILKETHDTNEIVHVIDQIVDLEHNTGSAFNKINHLYRSRDFSWFSNFLDAKAQHPTPYGYFDKMSPKAQQLIMAFYKAKNGLTHGDYEDVLNYHQYSNLGKSDMEGASPERKALYQKYKHMVKSRDEIIPKERS